MRNKLVFLIIGTTVLFGCKSESKIEKISVEKPYSIEIKKERSYFQAKKISDRVNNMGLEAYVIHKNDSIDGEWFRVLSGALIKDSLENYKKRIEKEFHLTNLQVVNYDSLGVFDVVVNEKDTTIISEHKRIETLRPDVPNSVLNVVQKYPDNNAFYLEQINLLNFDVKDKSKIDMAIKEMELDLPRGINIQRLSKNCDAMAEVIFVDNLYGDKVTMSVMKLKEDSTLNNGKPLLTAEKFADYILDTDKYLYEDKVQITIPAYLNLYGYRVTIETKKHNIRTYYVVVDEKNQYLFVSQSVDRSDKEMIDILSMIGKSEGLNDYDEFYNTFYVLPNENIEGDIFLGYSIDKLTWRYAESKGYTAWSKAMVGHWCVSAYFYNTKKGFWNFGLFDLLTEKKENKIYGQLYSKDTGNGKYKRNVYGVSGWLVENNYWFYRSLELNFGTGRYVYAIDTYDERMQEKDLMKRAEAMQFVSGGYK